MAVKGFKISSISAGFKTSGKLDYTLFYAPKGANISGLYTQSRVVAAPVIVSREHSKDNFAKALIINSGNANACTGKVGLQLSKDTCKTLSNKLGIKEDEILIASTGVIGVQMDKKLTLEKIDPLVEALSDRDEAIGMAAEGIMTTDLVPKISTSGITVDGKEYNITGIAKGSGMIEPNMATMIGCILTDLPLTKKACDKIWKYAVDKSFNRITVDGDTSTNDTAILMASGCGIYSEVIDENHKDFIKIREEIFNLSKKLALAIVADGEGATKLVEINVKGAKTHDDAVKIAYSIANSALVKTALFGCDANWGRIAGAAGRAGVAFNQDNLSIKMANILTCDKGLSMDFDEEKALKELSKKEIKIEVNINEGNEETTVWTCDLSYEYVKINGEYRS